MSAVMSVELSKLIPAGGGVAGFLPEGAADVVTGSLSVGGTGIIGAFPGGGAEVIPLVALFPAIFFHYYCRCL